MMEQRRRQGGLGALRGKILRSPETQTWFTNTVSYSVDPSVSTITKKAFSCLKAPTRPLVGDFSMIVKTDRSFAALV